MLPEDPVMLLSYVNTQFRDHYSSLEDLCQSLGADRQTLTEKLKNIDYEYDEDRNQFI